MEGLCSIYGLRGRGLGLGAGALQDKLYRACRWLVELEGFGKYESILTKKITFMATGVYVHLFFCTAEPPSLSMVFCAVQDATCPRLLERRPPKEQFWERPKPQTINRKHEIISQELHTALDI